MTNLILIITLNEIVLVLAACLLAVTGVVGWLVWRVWCLSRTVRALWFLSLVLLTDSQGREVDRAEKDS